MNEGPIDEGVARSMLSFNLCVKGLDVWIDSSLFLGMDFFLDRFTSSNKRLPTLRRFLLANAFPFCFNNFLTFPRGDLRLRSFLVRLTFVFFGCFIPSPKILSTTLSPRLASAPNASGAAMSFTNGRLFVSAGKTDRPPRSMTGSRDIDIWERMVSSPLPKRAGSKLNPVSAQGNPPRCMTCCFEIGSDISFCTSPNPNIFSNPRNPPCWRLMVLRSPPRWIVRKSPPSIAVFTI